MTAPDRLAAINLKLKRTKHHVVDLERAIKEFRATNPYEVGTKYDASSRKIIYYVARIEKTDPDIQLIAADALCGMMSTLDHIIYQLFLSAGGVRGAKGERSLYFPIFSSANEYKSSRERKVKGLASDAVDAIDAMEPYKGGAGHDFWVLQELNNLSKHRELVTVMAKFGQFDLGHDLSRRLQRFVAESFPGDSSEAPTPTLQWWVGPSDDRCPLNVGDELYSMSNVGPEVDHEMQFEFQVAIYEPKIVESQTIVEAMHGLSHRVELAIKSLEPFL